METNIQHIDNNTEENCNIENMNKNDINSKPIKNDLIYNSTNISQINILHGLSYIGRVALTIMSIYGLMFLCNCIVQYLALLLGILLNCKNTAQEIFYAIFIVFYSIILGNLLILPLYEFLTFPYLIYDNSMQHLFSIFDYIIHGIKRLKVSKDKLNLNDNNYEFNYLQNISKNIFFKTILNVIYIVVGLLILFAFFDFTFSGNKNFFDVVNCIFVCESLVHFYLLAFLYIILSCIFFCLIIKRLDFS